MERENETPRDIVNTVLQAVALGMGVSTVVMSILGTVPNQVQMILLGIGLACLALTVLDQSE
ncbi:MAG: hypothetical protein JXB30_17030 [Anaerolineae bacterium]|nr:hypothetical protein [Anaerolineae bacterium]